MAEMYKQNFSLSKASKLDTRYNSQEIGKRNIQGNSARTNLEWLP